MKKYLLILALMPQLMIAQFSLNIGNFSGIDSTEIGLVANWSSYYENHADSLSFNSTGLTISSINDDEVIMSAVTGLGVGDACRFTTPSTGTAYTILAINSLILTLDQTCTASTTDELYSGCLGSLEDQSDSLYHLSQATPDDQPKILWLNTDTVQLLYDGVDDILNGDNIYSLEGSVDYSITFWINPTTQSGTKGIFANSNAAGTQIVSSQLLNNVFVYLSYSGGYGNVNTGFTLNENQWYFVTLIKNGTTMNVYVDTDLKGSGTVKEPLGMDNFNIGARENGAYDINSRIDDFKIYSKVISASVMNSLYQNSRFYE